MARQSLNLARARKLAADLVKDNDSNADALIELFLGTDEAIKTEVLKTWYCQTEDFRNHFREYIGKTEEESKNVEDEAIETNAPAS